MNCLMSYTLKYQYQKEWIGNLTTHGNLLHMSNIRVYPSQSPNQDITFSFNQPSEGLGNPPRLCAQTIASTTMILTCFSYELIDTLLVKTNL